MANTQQISIFCGTNPNDGTGDPLRDAMINVNTNFSYLFSSPIANTSLTIGNTSVNVFANSISITIANNNSSVRLGNSTVYAISNTSGFYTNGTVRSTNATITSNTFTLGSSTSGSNGYTWLPNGLKMNWGWVLANSSVGNATFSSAFSTDCYVVTAVSNTSVTTYQPAVTDSNTTVAVIRTANAVAVDVYYMAIGK